MQIKRELSQLRCAVDDLYDMITTPTHDMSKQYLLIDGKINEIIKMIDNKEK